MILGRWARIRLRNDGVVFTNKFDKLWFYGSCDSFAHYYDVVWACFFYDIPCIAKPRS